MWELKIYAVFYQENKSLSVNLMVILNVTFRNFNLSSSEIKFLHPSLYKFKSLIKW